MADAPTLTDYRCCACAYAHHYHYSLDDDNDYRVPSLQAVFQSSHSRNEAEKQNDVFSDDNFVVWYDNGWRAVAYHYPVLPL